MWKLTSRNTVIRQEDSAEFMLTEGNAGYAQYLAWRAEGNTPEPADPLPNPAILSVSPRQIRMALSRAGLRTQVESAVAAGDQDLKDWYEFSTEFERVNPQVLLMSAALGVSEAQLDDLWALAATL